jgi:hypothetical protein
MPVEARCSGCGRQYRLKDRLAGKKFRCRTCRTVVSVPDAKATSDPWDDLDLDSSRDQPGPAEYKFETPPAPRRRRTRRKRSRSRRGGGSGMPTTITIAIGCEVALILFYILDFVRQVAIGEFEAGHIVAGVCIQIFVAMVNAGAALGYANRQNGIRWFSIVIASFNGLMCFGCGMAAVLIPTVFGENLPPDVEMGSGEMLLEGTLLIVSSIIRFVLVVCLLLRPSSEWFQG